MDLPLSAMLVIVGILLVILARRGFRVTKLGVGLDIELDKPLSFGSRASRWAMGTLGVAMCVIGAFGITGLYDRLIPAPQPAATETPTEISVEITATVGEASPSPTEEPGPIEAIGRIAFQSDRDGDYEIYVMNADGTNQVNITNNPEAEDVMPAWSP